jgi:hypothetical protein
MVVPERRPRVYVVFRGLVKNNALPEGTWQLSRPVPKAAAINYRVSIWAMRIKLSFVSCPIKGNRRVGIKIGSKRALHIAQTLC